MTDRDPAPPGADTEAPIGISRAGVDAVAAIAEHGPIDDSLTAVCRLVEATLTGSRCAIVRRTDGDPVLVSPAPLPSALDVAIRRWAARRLVDATPDAVFDAATGDRFADPTAPNTSVVVCDTISGLSGAAIGAICVTHEGPLSAPRRTVIDHARRLAQIALEQALAALELTAAVAADHEQIANTLHDDPIQAITVLSLMLQRLARDAPDDLSEPISQARQRADDAIERMRRLLRDLHPSGLAEDGLAVAIELHLEDLFVPLGIAWTLESTLEGEPDPLTSTLAFRLVREALANVATHADAASVDVTIGEVGSGIELTVIDNGRGFDPATIAPFQPGHLGLANIRYLARRNAGRFEVTSTPGHGCTVCIWLPR